MSSSDYKIRRLKNNPEDVLWEQLPPMIYGRFMSDLKSFLIGNNFNPRNALGQNRKDGGNIEKRISFLCMLSPRTLQELGKSLTTEQHSQFGHILKGNPSHLDE